MPPQPPNLPPPPQQPPTATVALTIHGSALTASPVTPSVRVNGWPAQVRYGLNHLPVYAGPVRIDVDCQWITKYGAASFEFTAQPGQTVPVFYAPPFNMFARGNIGHEPQRRPGAGLLVAVIAVPVLLLLLLSLL